MKEDKKVSQYNVTDQLYPLIYEWIVFVTIVFILWIILIMVILIW